MGTAKIQGDLWGQHAADWAELMEPFFTPAYEAVLMEAQVGPGKRVLDAGCGCGLFGALALQRQSHVSGVDATMPMLAIAEARAPTGDWRWGDLEELPFDDASFDVVTGFNSFQYAQDPAAALREARRVLKPGGLLVAMVWGKEQDCEAASHLRAIGGLLPPPPGGAPGGPFALSADGALARLVEGAGLVTRCVRDVNTPWQFPDLRTALRGMLSAGPAVKASRLAGESAVAEAVGQAIAPYRAQSARSYYLQNKSRYLVATK